MTVNLAQPGLLVSLPGILIVAVVAGRLLGVRRSVVANLVSGRPRSGEPGLTRPEQLTERTN